MSELLKKQNFGVEVEFTGITRAMAAKAVADVLGTYPSGPDRTCYHTSFGDEFKTCRLHMMSQLRKNAESANVA